MSLVSNNIPHPTSITQPKSNLKGAFEKPAFCRNVQLVTYATACATTTVATILVGLTVWNYRQTIGPMLKDSFLASQGNKQPRRSQAETILLLLLESGVLYFLFFVRRFPYLLCLSLLLTLFSLYQAVQFVAAIPRIHEWISAQPAVSFALTMYAFCSSVIVVSPTLLDFEPWLNHAAPGHLPHRSHYPRPLQQRPRRRRCGRIYDCLDATRGTYP